jgi:hypothetical protein
MQRKCKILCELAIKASDLSHPPGGVSRPDCAQQVRQPPDAANLY